VCQLIGTVPGQWARDGSDQSPRSKLFWYGAAGPDSERLLYGLRRDSLLRWQHIRHRIEAERQSTAFPLPKCQRKLIRKSAARPVVVTHEFRGRREW
jgi:hypothetical protein